MFGHTGFVTWRQEDIRRELTGTYQRTCPECKKITIWQMQETPDDPYADEDYCTECGHKSKDEKEPSQAAMRAALGIGSRFQIN